MSFILERRSPPPPPSPRRRRCRATATPRRSPRARSACTSVTMIRAPEQPIGCPSAQAPPLTFSRSRGIAEVAHRRHRDDRERLVHLEEVDVVHPPAQPVEQLADREHRRGGEPGRRLRVARVADDPRQRRGAGSAARRAAITSAAPPSEIDDEVAAVTVPPSRNAGLSGGIARVSPARAPRPRRGRRSRPAPP